MSDDYRTERVFHPTAIHDFGHDPRDGQRRHLPAHAYENPDKKSPHSIADVASVLGLAAEQLGPEALSAMAPLLSELERLRGKVEQFERRQAWLEQQSDRHSVVPCLSRRAFMRELDGHLAGGGRGVSALLQVAGVEALRQLHGLAAGEGALRHLCANIIGTLRSTDLVGCLGGSDFAILLPGADREHAQRKMAEIVARLGDPPYIWLGQRIPLQPAWGLHVLADDDGAEQAIAAADRQRRGLA